MEPVATAQAVLDREFLTIRCRLIDLAAALDRVDRADGSVADDPRIKQIRQGLAILGSNQATRTEQVQMILSLPYDPEWRTKYAMETK